MPILYERDISDADGPKAAKIAVVNSTFVKKYLDGREPLGHTVLLTTKTPFTIVGVAADSKYTQVRENPTPMAYFPYTQLEGIGTMHVELRAAGDPKALIPRLQKILTEFGPDLAMLQPVTQRAQFDTTIAGNRLIVRLSMFFGLLAVVLVATGLYGTIAYSVSRRTPEMGIRMALGAERRRVLWMVLREGLRLSALGILIGLPLVLASARMLSALLYGLTPNDPISLLAAALGIVAITATACYFPARRAASIDPTVALRNE